jgi:ribosomal protein S27E
MSKKCPRCGNTDCTIPEVEHHGEQWLHCLICGRTSKESRFNDVTVFDRITASPEVLAEEFVEMRYDRVAVDYRHYSMLTGEIYNSREEAFAATVEKLKEVCDE